MLDCTLGLAVIQQHPMVWWNVVRSTFTGLGTPIVSVEDWDQDEQPAESHNDGNDDKRLY